MRRLIAALCLSLLPIAASAADLIVRGPQTHHPDVQSPLLDLPCAFYLNGTINPGDGDRVIAQIKRSKAAWIKARQYGNSIVCLNSPGGSLQEALKIADFFRSDYIGTKLEARSRCESACALIFMSGSFFAFESGPMKWRVMHPAAKLGFHAPSLQLGPGQFSSERVSQAYALALQTIALTLTNLVQNRDFLDGEHMSPSLLAAVLTTPPDQMMYIETVDQAGRWNIQVGPLNIPDPVLTKEEFVQGCINENAWKRDASAVEYQDRWSERFVEQDEELFGKVVFVTLDEYSGINCKFRVQEMGRETYHLSEVNNGWSTLVHFSPPQTHLRDLMRLRRP